MKYIKWKQSLDGGMAFILAEPKNDDGIDFIGRSNDRSGAGIVGYAIDWMDIHFDGDGKAQLTPKNQDKGLKIFQPYLGSATEPSAMTFYIKFVINYDLHKNNYRDSGSIRNYVLMKSNDDVWYLAYRWYEAGHNYDCPAGETLDRLYTGDLERILNWESFVIPDISGQSPLKLYIYSDPTELLDIFEDPRLKREFTYSKEPILEQNLSQDDANKHLGELLDLAKIKDISL